ncbi:hypothetical protein [Burkholderia ambifaria]|uniref:hypothetical protein n=1 Tax=Burkholderia ambifaria TaxID=152480 RepID=UPI0015889166|nr:hypothetical protein [Burkholderia ambifaria]
MASVTIDIGSGMRATLSNDVGVRQSIEQRAAVSKLMLHWPKYSGLTTGAAGYLRELGLDAFQSDPVAALRSAIEDGRVSVSIEQPAASGGVAGGQPSTPPFPRTNRFASVPGVASLPTDKPLPSWATPSDVSTGELMSYLESITGAGGAPELTGRASTFLGNAQPFELSEDGGLMDSVQVAARSAADEEECYAQYERELEECQAYRAMTKDPYTYVACKAQAFANYNQCRGY